MQPEPEDFTVWIDRLKKGDEQAANVVWNTCFERLESACQT